MVRRRAIVVTFVPFALVMGLYGTSLVAFILASVGRREAEGRNRLQPRRTVKLRAVL